MGLRDKMKIADPYPNVHAISSRVQGGFVGGATIKEALVEYTKG